MEGLVPSGPSQEARVVPHDGGTLVHFRIKKAEEGGQKSGLAMRGVLREIYARSHWVREQGKGRKSLWVHCWSM